MVTNFTKSWTENVKARKGHEKFRGKLHKTRDDVSTIPFVEGPHAGKDVGADRSHLDHRPKAKAPAPREAALVQEGTGSHGKTEGKAGMHIPESVGITLVIEQKQKIASLTNLHALVTQMKFKEICQDKIPLGGRLEAFRENWEMITNDQKFLDSISGYKIEFQEQPIQKRPPKQKKLSQQETQILNAEIEEMLTKKAVEVVQTATENHFVSHLFVRPKKDGGMRPIFNLKALNQFVVYNHFQMEGFHVVRNIIQRGDWLCKVDLKDAYFCIPIHHNHRKFLRFQFKGLMLQYRSLPFGLATGSRLFTKVMKPIIALLRRIGVRLVIYLDDILLLNQSQVGLQKDRDTLLWLLHNLGWLVNWKKSVLIPSQKLEFLGLTINSTEMEITLSETKVAKIKQKCLETVNKQNVSIQELSSLIGTINSTVEAVIPASLYVRELQMFQTKSLLKTEKTIKNDRVISILQGEDNLVDNPTGTVEWEKHSNVHRSRPDNRDRCFQNRLGGILSYTFTENGGTLEPNREIVTHQCT